MKQTILPLLLVLLLLKANANASATRYVENVIEGIYQTQSTSYRIYNGNKVAYGNTYEFMIINNGDGTYYVDDLFGGWYCQRAGYGSNYTMTGNITIIGDGSVSLIDSYVAGWGDSLTGLTGIYDAKTSTFTIEEEYVSGMKFYQTWVKTGQIQTFKSEGIFYTIGENHTATVTKGTPVRDKKVV